MHSNHLLHTSWKHTFGIICIIADCYAVVLHMQLFLGIHCVFYIALIIRLISLTLLTIQHFQEEFGELVHP